MLYNLEEITLAFSSKESSDSQDFGINMEKTEMLLFVSYLMAHMFVPTDCKLTCHKKCYLKVTECGKYSLKMSSLSPHRVFGVPLHQLATGDGKVPLVVDRLITTIEMYGMYMEGIYRKSGVSPLAINQLEGR